MQHFWIFGYGSLMWRPGFHHIDSQPAVIHGFHRSLCVYSHVHRGTPERPGLVLGLDRGGSCHGMAFRVAEDQWEDTLAYLRAREQVTMVYLEREAPLRLMASGTSVTAITYVVDRSHRQYAGRLELPALVDHVRNSEGVSGHNVEYVRNTLAHLQHMGIRDTTLEALVSRLDDHDRASAS
jgi:cation transport protein ChaC